MLKFFLIIFQLIILTSLVLLVINNSFIISFEIKDYIYSISSSYLFIFLLIFFALIFLIQNFYFKIRFNFFKFKTSNKVRKKEKGYNSFVNGMIAIANKDYKKKILESKKVSNYLEDESSLSLLIKSEVFKVEKKYDQLKIVYEKMSKNSNTENLGYRGMMEQYLLSQDYHHAFLYGEKLFNNNPFIEKIYETLVNIIVKTNNWQQLLIITDRAYSNKIIDKKIFQENKSIAYYEIAKIKKHGDRKEALLLIEKALNLRKNFPPYINLYTEILIQNKKYDVAKKIIKKAWSTLSHPDLKLSILSLSTHIEMNFIELVKYVIGSTSSNNESKMLLIEAYINDKKWDEARNHIKSFIDTKPTKQVCLMMAKIEKGDLNDIQKSDAWTLRSNNGIESHYWICAVTNTPQDNWSSVSEMGYFNSLVWREPTMINAIEKMI